MKKQNAFILMGLTIISSITLMLCENAVQARNEVAQISKQDSDQAKSDVIDKVESGNEELVCSNKYCAFTTFTTTGTMHEKKEQTSSHVPPPPTLLNSERDKTLQLIEEETGVEAKILYAICMVETRCDSSKIGDNGNSYGAFQIHQGYHPGTIEMATDFESAARWTANRMIRQGYQSDKWPAVQCHNGCGINNGYWQRVKKYYVN